MDWPEKMFSAARNVFALFVLGLIIYSPLDGVHLLLLWTLAPSTEEYRPQSIETAVGAARA